MTIIIRSGVVKGGALPAQQPALARPTERLGSNRIVPNRRSEQVARYAAQRHSKTKRKRAEADAEAGGKTATDNEAERNAPAAQRRRLTVAPKTVTVPTARLAPAPRPGPSGGPAFAPAPTGKEPQERIQDDFSFVELLGPEVYKEEGLSQAEDGDDSELLLLNPENFNEAGLAGDDSAALQAFFEQNEWTGERMED
ncbi:hypothetical protein Pdw03_0632 [Penicillium digitatum]|uniref:Uncharacterized protein n=3 Tax=Penicillium digitatum TaxID=36651 RepID=K9F758_PEND2|nr:hypothetical protein PDIP_32840 [Penicillium digitatum Pd1]EKV04884.1 hypothetical protein PDIG_86850 [Penicillium digitatum PHI26]EKV17085.1 hypothetical protein PDIP_32840 [Penicillium digitatum Pd1]QQK45734.1 hypothetical protein Pdw03_0632 [Penicillium digitatum]